MGSLPFPPCPTRQTHITCTNVPLNFHGNDAQTNKQTTHKKRKEKKSDENRRQHASQVTMQSASSPSCRRSEVAAVGGEGGREWRVHSTTMWWPAPRGCEVFVTTTRQDKPIQANTADVLSVFIQPHQ